jgi:hypothetical protein
MGTGREAVMVRTTSSDDMVKEEGTAIELEHGTSHASYESQALDPAEAKMTLVQAIRRWPRVFLYSLGLTTAIILWGFDFVIVGSVASMPAFM